jgi:hypothetical protein
VSSVPPVSLIFLDKLKLNWVIGILFTSYFDIKCIVFFDFFEVDRVVEVIKSLPFEVFLSWIVKITLHKHSAWYLNNMHSHLFDLFIRIGKGVIFTLINCYSVSFWLSFL